MTNIVITFFASFLIWMMVLVSLLFVYKQGKKIRNYFPILLSPIIAVFISWIVKVVIPYANRPFRINGFPTLTLTIPGNTSFPSDHSAVAFSLAVAVFLYNKTLGIILLAGALLVGVARVLGNVHYPVDIFGGAILGSFVSLLIDSILRRKSK